MSGVSDQEKAVKQQLGQQGAFQNQLATGQFDVENPFSGYEPQFGYDDISKTLDSVFSGQKDIINRDTSNAIAEGQNDAVSSLASRGITGGSVINTAKSGIASDINKSKANALASLGINKASQFGDLMKYLNQLDFNSKGAGAGIESNNQRNILSGLTNSFNQQAALTQGLDDTTLLDDIFSGLKTGASIATAIAGIPGI